MISRVGGEGKGREGKGREGSGEGNDKRDASLILWMCSVVVCSVVVCYNVL